MDTDKLIKQLEELELRIRELAAEASKLKSIELAEIKLVVGTILTLAPSASLILERAMTGLFRSVPKEPNDGRLDTGNKQGRQATAI